MERSAKVPNSLTTFAGTCSIKVKVIHKSEVYRSLVDPELDYQIYTFEDEQGAKVKTVLYSDSLTEFEDVMDDQMEYEISNAKVTPIAGKDWQYPTNQVYHLDFNIDTRIDPIFARKYLDNPKYVLTASIPRSISGDEKYDVLGVLLYLNQDCEVVKKNGVTQIFSEAVIIDQSSDQTISITDWHKKAIQEYRALEYTKTAFPVVGFTALQPSYRNGFSLTITDKTAMSLYPSGEEASTLRAWVEANEELLTAKACHVVEVRNTDTERAITTVQCLHNKKVRDTLHEEKHWLCVKLKEYSHIKLNIYLGCSHCSTNSTLANGVTYTCHACFRSDVVSSPRMDITFHAADETGSFLFTASAEKAEILLKVTTTDMYSFIPQERETYMLQVEKQLKSTPFYIQVVPAIFKARTPAEFIMWLLNEISLH